MPRRSEPHQLSYRTKTSRTLEDRFADHIAEGRSTVYSHGDWNVLLIQLTAPDGTRPWSAHLEMYLPWVQPRGAKLQLPCWLLNEDLHTTTEAIRRSLDHGWSLARALHWAHTDTRPAWLASQYGWRTPTTGLHRVNDGRNLLQVLHDLEASPDDTLTTAGALIQNWTGTWQELHDAATAIAGNI